MQQFTNFLDDIKIASPCQANWQEMFGDQRQRYCQMCKLNVYNLSEMTKQEAENFVTNAEGRTCVKFYRRADGTILTKDCPVGWQAFEKRLSRVAKAFTSICAGVFSGIFAFAQFQINPKVQDQRPTKTIVTESIDVPTKLEDFNKTKDFPVFHQQNLDKDYQGSVGMLVTELKQMKSKRKPRR